MAPEEFTSLIEYYSWAEDINRGLENAADAAKEADSSRLKREEARIHSKCETFLSKYLEPVLKTLGNHSVSPNKALQPTVPPPLRHGGPSA